MGTVLTNVWFTVALTIGYISRVLLESLARVLAFCAEGHGLQAIFWQAAVTVDFNFLGMDTSGLSSALERGSSHCSAGTACNSISLYSNLDVSTVFPYIEAAPE